MHHFFLIWYYYISSTCNLFFSLLKITSAQLSTLSNFRLSQRHLWMIWKWNIRCFSKNKIDSWLWRRFDFCYLKRNLRHLKRVYLKHKSKYGYSLSYQKFTSFVLRRNVTITFCYRNFIIIIKFLLNKFNNIEKQT